MDAWGVIEQMEAAGLGTPPTPLDLSGEVKRFGAKKVCWYRLREIRTDGGSYVVVGHFGDWRSGETHRVEVDWRGISEAEREQLRARQAALQAEAEAERRREAELAALSAAELWRRGAAQGRSGYLEAKGLQGEACRYLPDGRLLVPLLRYDLPREQALRAVQTIWPDGRKRYTRGFAKPGCSVRLGAVDPDPGVPVLLCEGYATGLTLRLATERRLAVYVAIDAGNLQHVAQLLRARHPQAPLLICADDDWKTKIAGELVNVGRVKASAVARAVGAQVVYPVFNRAKRLDRDSDFDDLRQREGLAAVQQQLRTVLQCIAPEVKYGA